MNARKGDQRLDHAWSSLRALIVPDCAHSHDATRHHSTPTRSFFSATRTALTRRNNVDLGCCPSRSSSTAVCGTPAAISSEPAGNTPWPCFFGKAPQLRAPLVQRATLHLPLSSFFTKRRTDAASWTTGAAARPRAPRTPAATSLPLMTDPQAQGRVVSELASLWPGHSGVVVGLHEQQGP